MLTVSEDDHDVLAAMKAGAIGYILKGVSAAELLRHPARGRGRQRPCLAVAGRAGADRDADPVRQRRRRHRGSRPSARRTSCGCVARGQSNKEVAIGLGLQEKTVKHYMTIILEKLQARNRVEAALIARDELGRHGLGAGTAGHEKPSRRAWPGGRVRSEGRRKRRQLPPMRCIRARSLAVAGRSTTVLLFGSLSS